MLQRMQRMHRTTDSDFDLGATVENVNAPASPARERDARAFGQWVSDQLAASPTEPAAASDHQAGKA
jgi:hypothetical protein